MYCPREILIFCILIFVFSARAEPTKSPFGEFDESELLSPEELPQYFLDQVPEELKKKWDLTTEENRLIFSQKKNEHFLHEQDYLTLCIEFQPLMAEEEILKKVNQQISLLLNLRNGVGSKKEYTEIMNELGSIEVPYFFYLNSSIVVKKGTGSFVYSYNDGAEFSEINGWMQTVFGSYFNKNVKSGKVTREGH